MVDYLIGLDLGQSANYSALAILERASQATTWPEVPNAIPAKSAPRYGCRALRRWPLGTSYTAIVADVARMVEKPPLTWAALVIDATGVGRPVVDQFLATGLAARLVPVTITAGRRASVRNGFHHVPKSELIETLRRLFHQRRLQFAPTLSAVPALIRELQNHRVQVTAALHETFTPRPGEHDDFILALALAAWHGERDHAPKERFPDDAAKMKRRRPPPHERW